MAILAHVLSVEQTPVLFANRKLMLATVRTTLRYTLCLDLQEKMAGRGAMLVKVW